MNKIKVLAPHEAQKIAAGEVVERPANVLKELLENAIDAGSTAISIDIDGSGKVGMRVTDNGCGLSYDDAVLCVAPHATSKITSVNDLPGITTYGFRGEALASIAAVSQFNITTREADAPHGWQLHFVDGNLKSSSQLAIAQGTTVEVNNLFYNIPVRKKFLKQDETEWNQILQLVQAIALSHLAISFKLYHNDKLVIQAPQAASLSDRIAQLWGVSTVQQFLPLKQSTAANIEISGLITSHQTWRYGKHQIFCFVNKRWVKDAELIKALFKGYNGVLPPGKFPAGIINITVDTNFVDVNVHPKKEEVRFAKPQIVCSAIIDAVQTTLRQEAITTTTPKTISQQIEREPLDPVVTRIILDTPSTQQDLPPLRLMPPAFRDLGNIFETEKEPSSIPPKELQSTWVVQQKNQPQDVFGGKIIGQVLQTYIIIENEAGVIFVDQHAAHERILYERMKDQVVARESSLLIFPMTISFTTQELEAIEKFEALLLDFGISCNRMGPATLAIKAIPIGIANIDLEELLRKAAALIIEQEELDVTIVQKALFEHVHSHLACKRAVKAGDSLSSEQMERLLKDLTIVEKPFICIHGRPTYWRLEQHELEKLFRR